MRFRAVSVQLEGFRVEDLGVDSLQILGNKDLGIFVIVG